MIHNPLYLIPIYTHTSTLNHIPYERALPILTLPKSTRIYKKENLKENLRTSKQRYTKA